MDGLTKMPRRRCAMTKTIWKIEEDKKLELINAQTNDAQSTVVG